MKESPILFKAEMVNTILYGRKTQTRRVIKTFLHTYTWGTAESIKDTNGLPSFVDVENIEELCPYGQVGDRLWVRETWFADKKYDHLKPSAIPIDSLISYKATVIKTVIIPDWAGKTRSAIFMPRWASSINLEITEIRVQRLQDISEEDAIAEGMTGRLGQEATGGLLTCARDVFQQYWDLINGKKYPWSMNPFVVAISFKVVGPDVEKKG